MTSAESGAAHDIMPDKIDFDECCRIILNDWRWRQSDIAPPLREYKQKLLALLNQEFGIEWHDDLSETARHETLPALTATMPEDYAGLVSPFDRWIEYSPVPGETEILDRYRDRFALAEAAIKQRWIGLFRDLLLLHWPEAAHRTTSWARLTDLGLSEPVDEIDFI